MIMALDLRKLTLTVHVIVSVGWAGAVAAFLALTVAGLVSPDIQLVRASYLAMDLTYRIVVIPLGLASLGTGLVSSLATEWGLLRHYWVLAKLVLSIPAAILMLVHVQPVGHMAGGLYIDRKSTRLNSSHANISYAVFCLKKKKIQKTHPCVSCTRSALGLY